mmetsp:Transcript_24822/g.43698  ORF Transcript_24822/g.43698 Transcript_24822/m.43698 type:complete len:111 (-) Transcript_24822:592-924(-)
MSFLMRFFNNSMSGTDFSNNSLVVLSILIISCLAGLSYSIVQQFKVFNKNRFLELTFFISTFYFACTLHAARTASFVILIVTNNITLFRVCLYSTCIIEITAYSMLAYLW